MWKCPTLGVRSAVSRQISYNNKMCFCFSSNTSSWQTSEISPFPYCQFSLIEVSRNQLSLVRTCFRLSVLFMEGRNGQMASPALLTEAGWLVQGRHRFGTGFGAGGIDLPQIPLRL